MAPRKSTSAPLRLLLAGGGHSHLEVLRRYAASPDARFAVTLISPNAEHSYSGMLPGVVAGHYAPGEIRIPLAPLAAAARADFVCGRVERVNLDAKLARLATGAEISFDLLSLDVGSAPDAGIPGAAEHTVAVKPIEGLIAGWDAARTAAAEGVSRAFAMVGGGAGGVELLLAMWHRLALDLEGQAPRLVLVTDQPLLLQQHAPRVRDRLHRKLLEAGVEMHFDSSVSGVEPGAMTTATGKHIAADRIFWATAASAPAWLAQTGLGCDPKGFVLVNDGLQSVTHPFVFASGDCATQQGRAYPKSGAFAVRHGPPLAANLRRFGRGKPLVPFVPPSRSLALIATGEKRAILSYGAFSVEGRWVWRLKDRIDRDYIAKHRSASVAKD